MTKFSEKYRNNLLEEIQQQHFDLIIIGGGITGAGILLDAQDRGLKCCLLEMQDFGSLPGAGSVGREGYRILFPGS